MTKSQLDQCKACAARHGIDVPEDLRFQDIANRGQYYTRRGLQDALDAIEANKCQALIVWKVDRLTDKLRIFERVLERLEAKRALLWSATEPEVDISTPIGTNMLRMKIMWEIGPQRSTTAQRTADNRHTYVLRDKRPYASHSARYGYSWVVDESRTVKRNGLTVPLKEKLEPDPETAPVVKQMYAWVDAGRTLKWIARALSGKEDGGIHKKPTPFQHADITGANTEGEWSESSIGKMLQFPGYLGKWPAFRTKRDPNDTDLERRHPRRVWLDESELEWLEPSPAPALVTPAQWYRVKQVLTKHKEYSERNRKNKIGTELALLHTGMARCGQPGCGGPMQARPRSHENDDAEGNRQYGYECYASRKNHPNCKGVYCLTEPLDRAVQLALYNVLSNPDIIAQLARRSQEEDQAEATGITVITPVDEYTALKKDLDEMERDLAVLVRRSATIADDHPSKIGYDITIAVDSEKVKAKREEVEQAKRKADKYEQVERAIGQWTDYLNAEESNIDSLGDPYSLSRPHVRQTHRWWLELLNAKVIVHPAATVRAGGPLGTLRLHLTAIDPRGTLAASAAANGAVEVPVMPVAPEPLRHGGYLPHWKERDPDRDDWEGWTEEEIAVYVAEMSAYDQRYASGTLLPSDPTTLPTMDQWLAAYRKRHPATQPNPATGLPPGPTETPCG